MPETVHITLDNEIHLIAPTGDTITLKLVAGPPLGCFLEIETPWELISDDEISLMPDREGPSVTADICAREC